MRNIESIINEVEIWKDARNISYEPLNGGYVNYTYKLDVDGVLYVLRINGEQNSFLNLRREDEAVVIEKASYMGIAPKIYITKNKVDYLITEYKQGSIISCEEIHNPALIKSVAETLIKIHQINGIKRECSPFYLIEKYIEGAKLLDVRFPKGLTELLKNIEAIESRCSLNSKYTRKYCHNDYYGFNIINNNGYLYVIDWELSGIGDIFFDLATISFSNSFSEEEDKLLLKSYFGFLEDEHKMLLQDMKYMNMLREISWALLHSGMNVEKVNHDMDYYSFALRVVDRLNNGYVTL